MFPHVPAFCTRLFPVVANVLQQREHVYPRFVPAYPLVPHAHAQRPTQTLLLKPEQEEEEEARAEGDRGRMLCTRRAAVDSVCVLCVVRMEKSCGASACQAKCAKSRCLTLTGFCRPDRLKNGYQRGRFNGNYLVCSTHNSSFFGIM